MYNAQLTISRVQSETKSKSLTQKQVLSDCGLSENTLKKMSDRNGMASFNLAKIADTLDCSVDYLLGRTDNPQAHKCYNNANSDSTLSNQEVVLLELFRGLDVISQAKLIADIADNHGN